LIQPAYLTVKEVATKCGVRTVSVYSWIRNGDLKAINVAPDLASNVMPRYRVSMESLDEFLAARAVSVPGPPQQRRSAVREVPNYLGI